MTKKVTVDLKKALFVSLRKNPAARRFLIWGAKRIDETGKNVIEFSAQDLVDLKFFGEEKNAIAGINRTLRPFSKLKINQSERFFVEVNNRHPLFAFSVNPNFDYLSAVQGFRAFPMRVLEGNAKGRGLEKTQDIAGAAFIYAREHLDELAKNGSVKIPLGVFVKTIWGSSSSPLKDIKKSLEIGIAKVFAIDENFTAVPHYYASNDLEEYFAKSSITVNIAGDPLKNLLAAFGMKPAVQHKSEPMKIPFEATKEEAIVEPVNRRDVMMDTLVMLDKLKTAVMTHGRIAFDSLIQHALANSATDIETYKQYLEETRKKVADIVTELELCYSEWFGEEIEMGWRDILACKNGGDHESQLPERVEYLGSRYPSSIVWDIIGGFVLRLQHIGFAGKVDALGELGKINCVRFWLKENTMDWTIEELEEIIAGFEKNSLKEASQ